MFSYIRFCFSFVIAGFIGMVAGFIPQVIILEFFPGNVALGQALSVFSDIDRLSFVVCILGIAGVLLLCLAVEWKRWRRRRKRYDVNHPMKLK